MSGRLTTRLGPITMRNPVVAASGVLGATVAGMKRAVEMGAGAVVTKSITREPREGHPNPTVITYEAGMLNAVGISNPGADLAAEYMQNLEDVGAPVIASAAGSDAEEFVYVVERLATLPFAGFELALSCPHTPGFGTEEGLSSPRKVREVVAAVRGLTDRPLFAKLSPNEPRLADAAVAALEAGADGVTAVNTLGPGMIIDIETAAPVLGYGMGGVSGPALRPIAVRCVFDIAMRLRQEDRAAPIIGTGGVTTGAHAVEMMMAGAAAVGVGSAVYYRGDRAFQLIADEMDAWLDAHGYESVRDVVGKARL